MRRGADRRRRSVYVLAWPDRVYVGETVDTQKRIAQHRYAGRADFQPYVAAECAALGKRCALDVESAVIAQFKRDGVTVLNRVPGPKPGPDGILVGLPLRVPETLLERLRAAATRGGVSIGEAARKALARGLARGGR